MKRFGRWLTLALVLAMLCSVMGTMAMAEGRTFVTLKPGKTVNIQGGVPEENRTVYKLILKKDSVVTVSITNTTNNNNVSVNVYTSKNLDSKNNVMSMYYEAEYKTTSTMRALKKGTYYIDAEEDLPYEADPSDARARLKVTVVDALTGDNYAASRATELKARKVVTVGQLVTSRYFRWYKLKLKKKQVLSIHYEEDDSFSTLLHNCIYDSKLRSIYLDFSTPHWAKSKEKLPAGTYYIRLDIGGDTWHGYLDGPLCYGTSDRIYWK